MDMNNAKLVVTRFGGRSVLLAKKYSPQILTTVGIVGGITSAVMGAKATLKLERGEVLDQLEQNVSDIRELKAEGRATDRDLAFVYTTASLQIAKLYAPAVSLGLASIGCIISAQGIMQRRNAALTAAYVAVEKGFSEYRKRVEEALGEDKEKELRYDIKTERIDDTEKGEVREEQVSTLKGHSLYSRFFDETSAQWTRNADYNKAFLNAQQNFANDRLQTRGYLFLNDVYDSLGLERTQAGQLVGWLWEGDGDGYVDFGVYRGDSEQGRAFVNGHEKSILLDFNVDGVIYDKI